ncbi:dephospho-CoA kinase [Maricaulis sp. W15]|uniref:Dephospho-CoA kinase n=1 Tax=Maricaulis maris TaxID=74318 RepID=A0A495D4B0_9PROT|nr:MULTISPECIES: dephospho-CoA kinase [Maricaulis]OLF75552.1 dephospho-CoA kinase [Maricaulis sp. W15]RKQ96744.1 dephospho-CoA kinase [Maricaulis maris]
MLRVGLTGSIGMGKSATAQILREAGIPVFDSDAAVHALYARGGAAVDAVGQAFPGVVIDGAIDRRRLAEALNADPAGFEVLEGIVHPLVNEAREAFVAEQAAAGHNILVFDVPLLFETGGDKHVDVVIVVHAPDDVRRARVLQRPGMTAAKLDAIIARQLADSVKLERADHVVETSGGIEDARRQVATIITALKRRAADT